MFHEVDTSFNKTKYSDIAVFLTFQNFLRFLPNEGGSQSEDLRCYRINRMYDTLSTLIAKGVNAKLSG